MTNTLDPRLDETIRTRAHTARERRVEAAARAQGGRRGGFVPDGPGAIYLLVSDPPDEAGARGWTLLAFDGSERCWSATLGGHGAGAGTPRVDAQAAAERLLAGYGIRVVDWRSGESSDGVTSRAAVRLRRT